METWVEEGSGDGFGVCIEWIRGWCMVVVGIGVD